MRSIQNDPELFLVEQLVVSEIVESSQFSSSGNHLASQLSGDSVLLSEYETKVVNFSKAEISNLFNLFAGSFDIGRGGGIGRSRARGK